MKKLLILLLLLLPVVSFASFPYVVNTTVNANTTGDVSFTHTGAITSGQAVVVAISHRYGAFCIDGVTYGGTTMTRVDNGNYIAYLYFIADPPTGSQTVVVNFCVGGESRGNKVVAYTVAGIDLSDPVDVVSYTTAGGSGSSISTSLTTQNDETLVFDVVGGTGSQPSDSGNQNLLYSGSYSSMGWANGYINATSASLYSDTWSSSWTNDRTHVMVAFNPIPVVDNSTTTIYFSYDNMLSMNAVNGQVCETVGATTSCFFTFSTDTIPIEVNSANLVFILAIILFILAFAWYGYMLRGFKEE